MVKIVLKGLMVFITASSFYLLTELTWLSYMELSQHPSKADDSPPHRWAGILGTTVAVITLILPLVMIAYYSPVSSNAQSVPERIQSFPGNSN